jgi:hypothetical protein
MTQATRRRIPEAEAVPRPAANSRPQGAEATCPAFRMVMSRLSFLSFTWQNNVRNHTMFLLFVGLARSGGHTRRHAPHGFDRVGGAV